MFPLHALLAATICMLVSTPARAQAVYVEGEVIVKLKAEAGSARAKAFLGKAASQKGLALKNSFERLNMVHFQLSKGQSVQDTINDLNQDPDVLYAEPNYIFGKSEVTGVHQTFSAGEVHASSSATVSSSAKQTGAQLGLEKLWLNSSVPVNRPIVAIIDTGLDLNHQVMRGANALWTNPGEIPDNGLDDDGNGFKDDVHGWNFVSNSGAVVDDDGHGTHVAGIVLGADQNIFTASLRQAKIQIMPLKFLDAKGSGTTANAIRAINYALKNGATVLNSSWGGPSYSEALHEAVARSYNYGALFVAAAGNEGTNNDSYKMYPASYAVPNVISVAATTDRDDLASFSNYGTHTVHMASPGVYILSTLPGNLYGTSSGTSMAAPFVAGVAAQMKVVSPDMLGYQMRQILVERLKPIAPLNLKLMNGGRLDALSSVETATVAPVISQPRFEYSYNRGAQAQAAAGGCGGGKSMANGNLPMGSIVAVMILILAQVLGLFILRRRAVSRSRSASANMIPTIAPPK